MLWKKPAGMKYTEMCIYIDEHVPLLQDPDCPEEVMSLIYNYLWLLVKALAIKKKMFTSFQDYDGYSFYAANRLFFALKKNLENQGKIIKGREIRPIKSCLNYTKALLFPIKLEYLKETYNIRLSEKQTIKSFDTFKSKQKLADEVWQTQGNAEMYKQAVRELFQQFNSTLDWVLKKSPFQKGTADYQNLKISVLLNVRSNLSHGKGLDAEPITVLLWKLPKSMVNYVKLFMKELGGRMRREIMASYRYTRIDEKVLEYMMSHPEGEFIDHEAKD